MRNNHFNLKVLPLFEDDLNQITDYITYQLNSPNSAIKLVDEVYNAIKVRQLNPTIFEPFRTVKKRNYHYYTIRVRNYYIFYVVIENTMEVRRIIYSKRDFSKLI